MDPQTPTTAAVTGQRRWLMRGESLVASAGLAFAGILLSVMIGSAWWTARTQRQALEAAQKIERQAVGDLLARNVGLMLARGELNATRRMVAESLASYRLTQCRVVLSNGEVVAASDPSQITLHKLPAKWIRTRLADDEPGLVSTHGRMATAHPVFVPDRGSATLEIAGPLSVDAELMWESYVGAGAIGAAAMAGLWFVYRRVRSRLRALTAVREALMSMAGGEAAGPSLILSPDLGPEAIAWNDVVVDKERDRKQGVAERAREAFSRRGQGGGDLSSLCDAMSQGLILVDEHNRVNYANGAAAAFLQCKREELVGTEIGQRLQVPTVLDTIRQVATGTQRRRSVLDIERKSEEGPGGVLRFSVRPVRRDDSASAMVVIEDITQQKAAEAARHAFVAQATHELRTPLTNIRLYVETAIEDGENDPQTRAKCLNVINGETRRLERIVGEMLSVAEIEAGAMKLKSDDVRLETVFEELRSDYAAQAQEKKITLAFNLPPKLTVIAGDRDKIMLALHNLVGNALKYTPDGGKVDVTVNVDARQLSVEVRDTGIGMSQEDAEKVFERFYRAKDPRVAKITGTGLGLTIAREVVRLHGGDIAVESRLNQGSAFTLTVPVKAEAA